MPAQAKLSEVKKSLVASMAERFELEPEEFKRVVKSTCGLAKSTDEQFLAFLAVANQYDLNPLTRELFAFIRPDGGIQAIVGIDGWLKLANANPMFDGIQFEDMIEAGKLIAVTCRVYRKDRTHPVEAREYMKECQRSTDPWRQWPARMLRHKAAIQGIRMAFNLAAIMEPDEADRYLESIKEARATDAHPTTLDAIADAIPANEPKRARKLEDKSEVSEAEVVVVPDPPVDGPISEQEVEDLLGMIVALKLEKIPNAQHRLEKLAGCKAAEIKQSQLQTLVEKIQGAANAKAS